MRPVRPVCLLTVCLLTLTLPAAALEHTFELDLVGAHEPPRTVAVAGSFNGWSMTANPLTRDDADGVWRATLDLPEGVHLYKFVVDGRRWMNDPRSDAALEQPDGHGGVNSAVLIGFDPRKLPPARPDAVVGEALRHFPTRFKHFSVSAPGVLMLGVDTRAGDATEVYALVVDARKADDPDAWSAQPLALQVRDDLGLDTWAGVVNVPGEPTQLRYAFEVADGGRRKLLTARGVLDDAQRDQLPTAAFTADGTPTVVTPEWARDAAWYQVFAERFRNGDPSNDPGVFPYEDLLPWVSDWWSGGDGMNANSSFYRGPDRSVWDRRYGGDLQGLREALPYLRKLGVNALYLNPIFEAESMHKYDTADFRHVDDNFGVRDPQAPRRYPPNIADKSADPATWTFTDSDRVFLDFLAEAKRQGFRVVIDGVFNHVGRAHPYFMDVLERGPESPYAAWFEITDFGDPKNWRPMDEPFAVHGKPGGVRWRAWDGDDGHLPAFRKDAALGLAPGPREHIFNITRRWMDPDGDGDPSDGIDGWRLDVPGDIPHPFWIDWRQLVKSINPDAYIVGEVWTWAHPWLRGDQFDAVMNYQFAMAGQDFFVDQETGISASDFGQRLARVAYAYPLPVALVQQNLYDSHDTDRLASMFVNPDRPYDGRNRLQDNGPDYDPRPPDAEERRRMMQAVACKFTFVGAPMVYYGSEAGMWSPDDPSNRMPMVWADLQPYEGDGVRFMPDVFEAYRRLFALRHTLEPLRRGAFAVVHADDATQTLAYERRLGDEHVVAVFNRSDRPRVVEVPVSGRAYADYLSPQQTRIVEAEDAAARATLALRDDAEQLEADARGNVAVRLNAYGTAVLVPVD